MKTICTKHSLPRLLAVLILALCAVTQVRAQAFDGDDDTKVYLGYTNVGGHHGFELGYEEGLNDFFSYGTRVTFLAHKVDKEREEPEFYDYSDLGFYLNFHLMEPLKLPDNFDLYLGPVLSFKSASFQAGTRLNFGEVFGVYAAAQYNIFGIVAPRYHTGVFPEKFCFSGGITISF